jgi:hypothetical protein
VGEEEEEGCKLSVSFYSRYKNTYPPSHDEYMSNCNNFKLYFFYD